MANTEQPPAGWYPDPSGPGRRYWDGSTWTEHVDAQPLTPPQAAAQPVSSAPWGGAPATPATAPSGTAAGSMAGVSAWLRRLDGPLVVLAAAAIVLVSTVLPWFGGELVGNAGKESGTESAWSGDGPWLLTGPSAGDTFDRLVQGQDGGQATPIALLVVPLALAAGGLGFWLRQQRQQAQATGRVTVVPPWATPAMGVAAVLLFLLTVGQASHLSSWSSEMDDKLQTVGVSFSGGPRIGLWLALLASIGMTVGATAQLMRDRAG